MNDNQNHNTLKPNDAPTTPINNKPLFITEEESAPPPLSTQWVGGSADQQASEPVSHNSGTPTNQPSEPLVPPANRPSDPQSSLPPIMSAPPKKKGKGKLIAGIAAVLIIIVALPIGLILVGQNQELRKNAAATLPSEGGTTCTADAVVGTTTDSNGCTRNIHTREDCSRYEGGPYNCPTSNPVTTTPQPVTTTPGASGSGESGSQTGGAQCAENPGNPIKAEIDGLDIYSQGCAVVASFVSRFGTDAGAAWAAQHSLESVCNPTGIGMDTAACDGQTINSQNSINLWNTLYSVARQQGNVGRACINWVEEHNRAVNYCGGTPAGTTTTGGGSAAGSGGAPQCTGVRIYKYPYGTSNLIANGSQLRGGDPIKVCLVSTGNGTPMVNVNGREGVAQENGPQGEKCLQYDISADATTLNARGWINY
ncbi:MAG: hypothetical protein HYW33_03450 [Candidatus Blackburnbacteria bacterium]|nr:hypothetical protein [Candidatus Blackburnbacteria bacterium]